MSGDAEFYEAMLKGNLENIDDAALRNYLSKQPGLDEPHVDHTLRCPTCGRRADMCFGHGDDWKKR